ncbi:hypothetical protein PUN28_009345 [Cardiocondyla obscurior]|uniref:HSF-type DNA-binding domain-containing protein n=1 Tax=Cardiocondyla obscurior TaxID=286306 RepID=A0AAW2FXB8_9HYME
MYEDCMLQSMRFPQKLWRIVNECETGAIRWGANRDTVLLDYKKFQAEYLDARRPIFKTSNITSFIRQLNLYGFRKVTCRDPVCNSCNPYVHEFVHDNFRSDRKDLLANVCRKAAGKNRCSQHETARNAESPRYEANRVSRLKLCQLALTKTLEQIIQEYRQKYEQEKNMQEKVIIIKNNSPKWIRDSQKHAAPVLYEIEFSNAPNGKPTKEQSVKYSLVPVKTNTTTACKTISSFWRNATMDKRRLQFNFQNVE